MKTTKTIIFVLALTLGFSSQALGQVLTEEQNQSPQELYDFHIKKKRTNITFGWITLGGGLAMVGGGILWNLFEGNERECGFNIVSGESSCTGEKNTGKGLWLSYLGGATTLASIPLFISAGKHKRKAKIQLHNGAVGLTQRVNYSGISLTYSF